VSEQLRGAPHLHVTAGQDRDRGSTLLDSLRESMGMLGPVGWREKGVKVLCEAVVERAGRLAGCAPCLVAAGELDAVGREAIAEQRQAGAIGGVEVIEHG
jgi:hypothetical protein